MKHLIITLAAATALTACGTTSGIKTANMADGAKAEEMAPDFSAYNAVLVNDFTDGTKKHNMPEFAGRNFADIIAAAVKSSANYDVVTRDADDVDGMNTIAIGGEIQRYEKGSSAMRMIVGFGAGSSYFDAAVKMTDLASGDSLGEIEVDKNSYPLGGTIAMTQTVDTFMEGAAEKIAEELAAAKSDETDEE